VTSPAAALVAGIISFGLHFIGRKDRLVAVMHARSGSYDQES
jgi:hypothetical protein